MASFEKVPTQLWMLIPRDERMVIVEAFGIERTGITKVYNDTVESDGYTSTDLEALTAERMAEWVGSDADFPRLWELTVAKARSIVNPPEAVIVSEAGEMHLEEVPDAVEPVSHETVAESEQAHTDQVNVAEQERIAEQQANLQAYEQPNVVVEPIIEVPSEEAVPVEFTDKTPKHAKGTTAKK